MKNQGRRSKQPGQGKTGGAGGGGGLSLQTPPTVGGHKETMGTILCRSGLKLRGSAQLPTSVQLPKLTQEEIGNPTNPVNAAITKSTV